MAINPADFYENAETGTVLCGYCYEHGILGFDQDPYHSFQPIEKDWYGNAVCINCMTRSEPR